MGTVERQYWVDLASRFIDNGRKVVKREGEDQHPYMKEGFSVNNGTSHFDLGSLVCDNFFETRSEEFGEPESPLFREFSDRLADENVVNACFVYDDVVITEGRGLEVDGFEFLENGKLVSRVAVLGVDHILNSDSARIASDIKKVDENLRKERSKKDKYSDHPYQRGRKFVYTTSQERTRAVDIWMRLENFFYNSIPNVREKEKEFKKAEIRALSLMGFDAENGSPWSSAINAAFGDGNPNPEIRPFDWPSYEFFGGGKPRFFREYLLGRELFEEIKPVCFERPEGENRNKTEYDRKSHFRIPGVLFSAAGQRDDNERKGVYFEVNVENLDKNVRNEILQRALEFYNPFLIGEAYYRTQNLRFPYEPFVEDLRWVIGILDHSQLPKEKVWIGELGEEEREVPIYSGKYDEYGCPKIKRKEIKPVKFFRRSDGKEIDFYELSELNLDSIEPGTEIKAFRGGNSHWSGYDLEAAIPFYVGKSK